MCDVPTLTLMFHPTMLSMPFELRLFFMGIVPFSVWSSLWALCHAIQSFLSFSGLGHVTSDKQIPSALEYFGHFKNAVSIEKRLLKPGASKALRDILNLLVAQYNKMTTNKKHRIDTAKRALIYNMFLSQ